MRHEFLVNGQVTLVLIPENEMEEQLLKQLMRQTNDLTEIRTALQILGKPLRNGVILSPKGEIDSINIPVDEAEKMLTMR
jgi:hypothetical protein